MKKYILIALTLFISISGFSQTTQQRLGLDPSSSRPGYVFNDTVYFTPHVPLFYFNAYGNFVSLKDTASSLFSVAKIPLSYNSSTGVFDFDTTTHHSYAFYQTVFGSGGGGSALSALTSATAAKSFDNGAYKQTWTWNSLSNDTALVLQSNNTVSAGLHPQVVFAINLSGVNGAASLSTDAAAFSNTKTGAGFPINNALVLNASGASTNNAVYAPTGDIAIVAGKLGIGGLPLYDVHLSRNLNSTVRYMAQNSSSGSAALIGYQTFNNINTGISIYTASSGYATSGMLSPNASFITANTGSALSVYTADTLPIRIGSNAKDRMYVGGVNGSINVGTAAEVFGQAFGFNGTTTKTFVPPILTTTQRDKLLSNLVGTISGGSGYANGTAIYLMTGGTGTGAIAAITVAGGVITKARIMDGGAGFVVGDVLTAAVPSGSGFTYTLTSITPPITGSTVYNSSNGRNETYNGSMWLPVINSTTLVSGTKAITIPGLTTGQFAFVTMTSPSGTTLTTSYQAVCTTNTLTIQANVAAGTINTADGSTLNYEIK